MVVKENPYKKNNNNNFQIAKDHPQTHAWFLLNFLPISAWRLLMKVLLIKKCVSQEANTNRQLNLVS